MTVQDAIDRSIAYDETVTIDWDEEGADYLGRECDGSVDVEQQWGITEYWGVDEAGSPWRVHMREK